MVEGLGWEEGEAGYLQAARVVVFRSELDLEWPKRPSLFSFSPPTQPLPLCLALGDCPTTSSGVARHLYMAPVLVFAMTDHPFSL